MNYNVSVITILFAIAILTVTPTVYAIDWYDSDWQYAKSITINSTQVDSTLTDFPLLIDITDTNLTDVAQADCDDVIFVDSTNSTKYAHEIERCTLSSNDKMTAWVKIPSISSSVDTELFMYYGNSTMTSQENVTGTWNSDFQAVWHLHDDFLDSTANSVDGTNSGTTNASIRIADSQGFDGVNDYIRTGTSADLNFTRTDAFTMSLWGWADPGTSYDDIISKQLSDGSYRGWSLNWGGGGTIRFNLIDSGGGTISVETPVQYDSGAIHNIFATYDGSSNGSGVKIYVGGVQVSADVDVDTLTGDTTVSAKPTLGQKDGLQSGFYMEGGLDEVRVATGVKSDDWIKAEYNNQKASSTFITVGSQGTDSGGNSYTIETLDELGLDDSVEIIVDTVANITDDLGLDDSVQIITSATITITDDLGLDDSVEVLADSVADITDGLGLDDSVQVDIVTQVYNAIKLFLAPPTETRLGGVFAFTCPSGEYVYGITTNGTLLCSTPP